VNKKKLHGLLAKILLQNIERAEGGHKVKTKMKSPANLRQKFWPTSLSFTFFQTRTFFLPLACKPVCLTKINNHENGN